ncbi:MAG: serpin family protein [Clostridia bacterium]|nr:serpin family protein [Clostridia bacterium]
MNTKRMVKLTALLLVFSLILAGCSSEAITEKTTATTAVTTTATTTVVTSVTTTTESAPTTTVATDENGNVITTTTSTTATTTSLVSDPTKPTTPPANTSQKIKATDMMAGIKPKTVAGKDATEDRFVNAHTQFAVKLLQGAVKGKQGKNVLVSPLSVQLTLAMVANGAAGKTKTEMETVFGGIPMAELNQYLYNYWTQMPNTEEYKVSIANSLWINSGSGIKVPKSFLQTVADYYGAQVYKSNFGKQTVADMNNWVKEYTNGMIDSIVNELDSKADMLMLLNTLFFEADWKNTYGQGQVSTGTFTTENGTQRSVRMLSQTEKMRYISDGEATGFAKDYKDGYYSFVALLPNEGTSLDDYIASLTAEKVRNALNSGAISVYTEIPKFAYDCDLDMNAMLSEMGMPTAFGSGADFSGLDTSGKGTNLGEVRHKTHIELSEEGTKAGAVTSARVQKGLRDASVCLDRPFVYMIVDNTTYLPIFVGAVKDITG